MLCPLISILISLKINTLNYQDHLNMICIFYMISKYHKFRLMIDLFEIMSKPSTDLPLENLIKWVFVKIFESQSVLEKMLNTEFWIVNIFLVYFQDFCKLSFEFSN